VALLITAATLCVGCAATPPSSPALSATDQDLADRVSLALNNDPTYLFRHVDVSVTDGVASLSGYVWSTDAIYRARRIALDVSGVRRVVTSRLELERNGSNRGPAR
jgi:osmotically-inducible protein OsmY